MNQNFNSFFENPSIEGIIGVFLFVAGQVLIAYLTVRSHKKTRAVGEKNSSASDSRLEKLEATFRIFLDQEQNNLNKQSAEETIESTLRHAENSVKSEVMRIFHHNHRDEPRRQVIIKKAIHSVSERVYDSCITSLKTLSYKEKNLSEFMVGFDVSELKAGLLEHTFSKSGDDTQDLSDTLFFTETFFTSIITNAKSYYSNL